MKPKRQFSTASILISAAAALLAGLPTAAAGQDYYKGKTVTLYVGSGAGGGYDFFGRVFVKYFDKHIPGNPTVIVVNRPGAGGTKMTNWAANAAPKNGLAIGMPLMPVATNQHLRPKAVRYDARELNWIGNMERSIAVLFTWHTSKTKTIDDARKRVTLMGGSGKSSPIYQTIALSNRLLGTKFKVILGYKGGDRALAIERGEVEGSFSTLQNFRAMTPHWFEGGKNPLNVLVQNAVVRSPELPDVPTMMELAKTDEDRKVFEYMMLQSLTGRSIFAPPGVPKDRVNILRRAFDRTMKDPGFVAEIEKSNLKLTPSTGEEVEKAVAQLVTTPPAIVARIRELIK